jgi:hypothetical protein
MGTPEDMRGPSAGFGHFSSPRTNDANALVGSMTEALFLKDIKTFGWARNYALLNLRRLMVDGFERYQYECSHWRYYGDPTENLARRANGANRSVRKRYPGCVTSSRWLCQWRW